MLKEPKVRSRKHRMFVASLPCLVCRIEGRTQAAHIRVGNNAGTSLKSGDDCCVPLCVECHAEQHHFGERKYWGTNLNEAQNIAKLLYENSGDKQKARLLIGRFQ